MNLVTFQQVRSQIWGICGWLLTFEDQKKQLSRPLHLNRGCQGRPNVMSSESKWSSREAPLCLSLGSSEKNGQLHGISRINFHGRYVNVPYRTIFLAIWWGDSSNFLQYMGYLGSWNGQTHEKLFVEFFVRIKVWSPDPQILDDGMRLFIWVCLKIVYPEKPNGFADHYPY